MDFSLPTEATDAAGLAATIFTDHCTSERLRAVDQSGDRFDAALWSALGDAGLLGLALPEEYGGAGLGVLETTAVLIEAGKTVAPVPLPHHYAAAAAIAHFGDEGTRAALLADAASGSAILTIAPRAGREGSHDVVPAATRAGAFLVPVEVGGSLQYVVARPADVSIVTQTLTDGEQGGRLTVTADLATLPSLGAASIAWVDDQLTLALAAQELGIVDGALALTAEYARTREQFGRAIGTFQAVSQRLADGYIDVLGLRLMVLQAAWRVSESLPATAEVAGAALWAADAGHRLAHTTVHVHGGVGIDLDGDAHRYFTAAKRGEFLLGGTTAQARAIGAVLAAG